MESPVDTSKLSTLMIGGKAKRLDIVSREEEVAFVDKEAFILGEGSNVVFGENLENLIIAKIQIHGIKTLEDAPEYKVFEVGAGENWDEFVAMSVKNGLSGIEALSGIPGTVGASPIQNIGAYGSEAKESIVKIKAWDREQEKFVEIENKDCNFSYRNSTFKKNPKKFIITRVYFKLWKKDKIEIPKYKDVENYFKERSVLNISLQNVRDAILEIRKKKLPDPRIIPNCGSFFKNPIVSREFAEKLKTDLPDLPIFHSEEGVKIPAGFLIEKAGFKGKEISNIVIYKENALVLTNPNKATFSDLIEVKRIIENSVFNKFGIKLEPEVNIIEKI